MTRKHFRLLAKALITSMPTQRSDRYEAELLLFESIVNSIMSACAEANPHFDRSKFAKACGVDTIQRPSLMMVKTNQEVSRETFCRDASAMLENGEAPFCPRHRGIKLGARQFFLRIR